jgi:hypothetical protein
MIISFYFKDYIQSRKRKRGQAAPEMICEASLEPESSEAAEETEHILQDLEADVAEFSASDALEHPDQAAHDRHTVTSLKVTAIEEMENIFGISADLEGAIALKIFPRVSVIEVYM